MTSYKFIFLVISLLLIPLTLKADLDQEAPMKVPLKKKFVVEGMVYFQSCKDMGTDSLSGATRIPYARVSVTCSDHKEQVFYYKEYTANYYGYFYAELEGVSLFDHPLTSCKVKLVSSPVKNCNVPTDVNDGISGASLRREHKKSTKHDCDYVFYATGPLAFGPAQCISGETRY